jgi:hypothetical protein
MTPLNSRSLRLLRTNCTPIGGDRATGPRKDMRLFECGEVEVKVEGPTISDPNRNATL